MWRFLFIFIAFLIAHGGNPPSDLGNTGSQDSEAPFDPTRSWLLGSQRGVAMVLAITAGASWWVRDWALGLHRLVADGCRGRPGSVLRTHGPLLPPMVPALQAVDVSPALQ